MRNVIESYVLNDYLSFDRKIYSIFGINIGRAIQFKSLVYFIVFLALEVLLALLPVIGLLVRAMPLIFWVLIPGFLAYLLTDVGTENRSPVSYFASFFRYQVQRVRKESYYQGKVVPKMQPMRFQKPVTLGKERKGVTE